MPLPERTLNVFMDQNNKCNLKCTMCGFSDARVAALPKHDMPFWLFRKIAEQVFPRTQYLALSCLTEPLMTRDFDERIRLLASHPVGFSEVITNGLLLNERLIDAMIDIPISRIAISIDGATKETYEAIRVGASFEKLLANVRLLEERKARRGAAHPRLRINHVISEMNVDELPLFLELVESLGAQAVDFRTVLRMSNAVYQGTREHAFYEKVVAAREAIARFCARTGAEDVGALRWQPDLITLFTPSGEPVTCRRPWDTVAIHANGDLMPCISWTRPPYGNLAESDFEEIFAGPALAAIRAEFEREMPGIDCEHCTIKKASSPEEHDDFFYLMLKKPPAPKVPGAVLA
jgi:MoaA/NifB/PqqE/SkfB family radical SAM enzyme